MSRAQTLITDNIATWTGAIQAKSTAGRGSSNKYELYGIKKLRELILELAVRGKLVPQDLSDEPASVLLERIAAEKAELIKQGKIKKSKALPPVSDEEKPFELPEGWVWSRLPNTCHYKVGKTPSTKNSIYWTESENGIPWVSISDLNHFGIVEQTTKKITPVAASDVFKSEPASAGTILMSFKLTLGKISMLNKDAYHNEAIISISPFTGVSKQFIFKVLPQRALAGNSKQAIKGNTLNSESLNSLLIPVPPFSEQQRIIQKVDELMALCDQLEQQTESSIEAHSTLVDTLLATLSNSADADELQQNWARIAGHFDTLFTTEQSIDALKQTILQLAVMGKLVRQNPNDEPAAVLLERIAAEKDRLVKEKKLKKEKALPDVKDNEMLFELPAGWNWCRLDALSLSSEAGWSPQCEPTPREGDNWGVLKVSAVTWGSFNPEENKALPKGMSPRTQYEVKHGDFLISRANTAELVARAVVVPTDTPSHLMMSDKIIRFTFSTYAVSEYINLVNSCNYSREYYATVAGGTSSSMKNVSRNQIRDLVIPLPPFNEQHRIIAKVDELMTLCEQLKDKLRQSQQTQVHLTDAIIEQTLGQGGGV